MQLAINEALKAKGFQKPNPSVGAIIVKDNQIIGSGFHAKSGDNHAEVNAINDALTKTDSLEGATIYVTLTPCSKHGKTRPCVDLIIKHKFKQVIIGSIDPSDNDAISLLKSNNILVETGIMEKETDELICDFKFNIEKHKTFVVGKVAMTLDGKIATKDFDSKWITDDAARMFSRKKRANFQAILVGVNTLIKDNPMLSTRIEGYKNPIIVVINDDNIIDPEMNIFKNTEKKIIFSKVQLDLPNTDIVIYENELETDFILEKLYEKGIKSLLVEGGSYTLNKFIKQGNINLLDVYIAPKLLGDKNAINAFDFQNISLIKDSKKLKMKQMKIIDETINIEYEVK